MENNTSYNKFLDIKFIYPLLIFLSVLRLFVYYSFFGINIIPFLTFTEIITSFLDSIIMYVIITAVVVLLFIITPRKLLEIKPTNVNLLMDQRKLIVRIKRHWSYIKILLIYTLSVFTISFILYLFDLITLSHYLSIVFSLSILNIIFFIKRETEYTYRKQEITKRFHDLFQVFNNNNNNNNN